MVCDVSDICVYLYSIAIRRGFLNTNNLLLTSVIEIFISLEIKCHNITNCFNITFKLPLPVLMLPSPVTIIATTVIFQLRRMY